MAELTFDHLIPGSGVDAPVRELDFEHLIPKGRGETAKAYAEDIARSAGSGIARGVIGVAGLPALVKYPARTAGQYVGGKIAEYFGGDPNQPPIESFIPEPPTSEEAISAASRAGVPGLGYQPQTRIGEYARTVGEFLPASVIGPGGAARNALRFGLAPGIASEAAGQATKGTWAERRAAFLPSYAAGRRKRSSAATCPV